MGYSPHLFLLIFASTFLAFSFAIDRTSWSHVCGGGPYQALKSCEYRKNVSELLKKIRTAGNTVISTPFRLDDNFKNCWEEIYYKRNRTEEKFKKHIDHSLGVPLFEYITKMVDAVNALEQHDNSAGSLLREVEGWRQCAVEQKSEQDCKTQAAVLATHNPVPNSAAQLVHTFHDAVTNAHIEVVDRVMWGGSWCESELDKPFVFKTDFTTALNALAISLNHDFREMEKIDQREEAYLKLLEEFRTCETIRGRYALDCAEIRIRADKIGPKNMAPEENNRNLDKIDRQPEVKEKKEKHRKILNPSVGFMRPALGPTHLMTRVYEKETEKTLSDFFTGVKNSISSLTDEIIDSAASLFKKVKSSPNCEKYIRETPVINEANELSLIHNITKDIIHFRAKYEQYVTVEDEYVACVEKHLKEKTEETVKKTCNEASIIKERENLLANVNEASTPKTARYRRFFPHNAVAADKALLGNQIWAGSWGNLQSKVEDLKEIGQLTYLAAGGAPSKLIQKLSSNAQCEVELYDGKLKATSEAMNIFDEKWKNTLVVFEKLNGRMNKEFEVYELLTKLAVCSDEDEFSCFYLRKQIENLLA